MDERRAVVLAMCLVICLGLSSMAWAATIPSGQVSYPPGHYLAGQTVETGVDVFGWNFQAQRAEAPIEDMLGCWEGLPPFEGESGMYMRAKWNDAYLSTRDLNGDGYLDWHPLLDFPDPANHLTFAGNWQGSGAVFAAHWTWPFAGGEVETTWVAVPTGAYLEWVPMGGDCSCPTWFASAGGPELGPSAQIWPVGDRLGWIAAKQTGYCDGALVCFYESPTLAVGVGGKAQ